MEEPHAPTIASQPARFGHDFSRTPVHAREDGQPLDAATRRRLEARLPTRVLGPPPTGLSSPGDAHEREADAAAHAAEAETAQGSRGGHDLSDVRVHYDSDAAARAARLGADAFTVGRDIYFGAGRYRPDTAAGRRLIAHEAAHVVQQRGASRPAVQRQPAGTATTPAAKTPAGRVANEEERKIITRAEAARLNILSKALPLVMDLVTAITIGDPSVTLRPRGPQPKPTDKPGLDVTKRAAVTYLSVNPNTYDWLNDKNDREALDTISTAARLMSANLGHALYPKRVFDTPAGGRAPDPCAAGKAADNDGTNINLQPDFFVSDRPPMPSPDCPGIILLHEYFHHLPVHPEAPRFQQGRVFHGEQWSGMQTFDPHSVKYSLHDAYSLTSFAVHVALGQGVECVCPKKGGGKK